MMRMFSVAGQRLAYRAPEYREARGALVLLVWGDVPYWTVVDTEFETLLQALDGQRTVGAVIDSCPAWQGQRDAIVAQLRVLRDAGVFAPVAPHRAKPPLYGTRIESVAINLTRRCNLRCRFCYNLPYLTSDTDQEVTVAEVDTFLRQIRPFVSHHPILTLLGGEPLLDSDKLLAVAAHARRQGYTVLVSTNGTRVTEEVARQAARLGMQVQVSIDGPSAELHDAVRGRGAFDGAVAGVRTLVRHGVHTIVSMVCHQGNVAYLGDFYRFAQGLGVAEARFIPLKCLGGAARGDLTPVPLNTLLHVAYTLFTQHPEYLALTGSDAFAILANTCRYSARRVSCGTGLQTVLLDADGTLYPCLNTNHPDFAIAQLREAGFDFRRVWRSSPVLHRLRRSTALCEPGQEHAGCPVRYWCLGGCRGENHALTGSLGERPPHCAELRRGILDMCWMLAERPDLIKPSRRVC